MLPPQPLPSRYSLAVDHLHLLGASWAAILAATISPSSYDSARVVSVEGGDLILIGNDIHLGFGGWLLDDEIRVLLEVGMVIWSVMRWWLRWWMSSSGTA